MNITEIRNPGIKTVDYTKFSPNSAEEAMKQATVSTNKNNITDKNDVAKPKNWNKEVLMQGLDFLENKIQMANTGLLLDKAENRPIESFEEAMAELSFVRTELFKSQASNAQANISPQVVFDLLTEVA